MSDKTTRDRCVAWLDSKSDGFGHLCISAEQLTDFVWEESLSVFESVADEDRAKLEKAGYKPTLRWERQNLGRRVICSTGEALKNIEVEEWKGRDPRNHTGDSDCG